VKSINEKFGEEFFNGGIKIPGRYEKYQYEELNKDYLPFKDEAFDFVTFLGTIEYLDNHEHAINEIKRVLKRGGGLYLTTIFKRRPEDKIRINVHDRKYWIKEFEYSGFRFEPQKTNNIIKNWFKNMTSLPKESMIFKIGKIFCQSGYIGENIFLLAIKLFNLKSGYGALYFTKVGGHE